MKQKSVQHDLTFHAFGTDARATKEPSYAPIGTKGDEGSKVFESFQDPDARLLRRPPRREIGGANENGRMLLQNSRQSEIVEKTDFVRGLGFFECWHRRKGKGRRAYLS